ncbi:MAG: helix-turn-helix transcriptional regulator [Acidobacteriaceae bacterium]
MPFCHTELRAAKPRPPQYPKQLSSLGDHIRARRLDLKLLQGQVADQIGVHEQTITGWERNATSPEIHCIPAIINFLGYNPLPLAGALPEQLATVRMMLGLSQRKLAEMLGMDESTVQGWEARQHKPIGRNVELIERFLETCAMRNYYSANPKLASAASE